MAEGRRRLMSALKWSVTLGAFAFLLSRQPLAQLADAIRSVSPASLAAAFAMICAAVALTGVRWSFTMRAYGAERLPRVAVLLYYTWLGLFYNTYVPGAVGGDVVRGYVSRQCFGDEGTARAVSVVFIDRLIGLSSMLSLLSTVVFLVPLPGLDLPPYAAVLGPFAALAALLSVSAGRIVGGLLPGKLGAIFASLPKLERPVPLVVAFGFGVLNHVMVAVAVHWIMASVSTVPTFGQSLVVVPTSNATGFLPISIAGVGLRDTAFVALYELLGVDRAVALAGALSFLVCLFAAAGIGGIWQLVRPLSDDVRDAATQKKRMPTDMSKV